jgi:hypothetical protein
MSIKKPEEYTKKELIGVIDYALLIIYSFIRNEQDNFEPFDLMHMIREMRIITGKDKI